MHNRSFRFRSLVLFLGLVLLGLATPAPAFAQETEELDVADMMREATSLLQSQEFTEAAEWFQRVVKEDPKNGQAWQLLGYSLHSAGKLDEAIQAHTRASQFDRYHGVSLYNLGCAYSLKGEIDKSLGFLDKAVAAGFKELNYFQTDQDLNAVRKDERFQKILARVKGTEPKPKDDDESKPKGPSLVGTWSMQKGSKAGEETQRMPPEIKITKDTFVIPTEDPSVSFVMAYQLDTSKKPIQVDLEIKEGPGAGGKALGIIKLAKGKMTLCYNPAGERPSGFEPTAENGNFLFVMQRKPRKFNPKRLVGTWDIMSGSRAGEDVAKDRLGAIESVTITADTITLPAGPEMVFVMGYKIDSTSRPIEVDMVIKSGPAPEGSEAVGILKMQQGNLVLCYDSTGQKRPTAFKTSQEDGFFMFTLKKKQNSDR